MCAGIEDLGAIGAIFDGCDINKIPLYIKGSASVILDRSLMSMPALEREPLDYACPRHKRAGQTRYYFPKLHSGQGSNQFHATDQHHRVDGLEQSP